MNNFKDFNIKPKISTLVGDKIKIERVLNREITVTNYRVEPSKVRENTKCLHLELQMNGNKHVLFSGSSILIQMIEKVDREKLPFVTTIVKEGEHCEFT